MPTERFKIQVHICSIKASPGICCCFLTSVVVSAIIGIVDRDENDMSNDSTNVAPFFASNDNDGNNSIAPGHLVVDTELGNIVEDVEMIQQMTPVNASPSHKVLPTKKRRL